jgi:hypothetical protein
LGASLSRRWAPHSRGVGRLTLFLKAKKGSATREPTATARQRTDGVAELPVSSALLVGLDYDGFAARVPALQHHYHLARLDDAPAPRRRRPRTQQPTQHKC